MFFTGNDNRLPLFFCAGMSEIGIDFIYSIRCWANVKKANLTSNMSVKCWNSHYHWPIRWMNKWYFRATLHIKHEMTCKSQMKINCQIDWITIYRSGKKNRHNSIDIAYEFVNDQKSDAISCAVAKEMKKKSARIQCWNFNVLLEKQKQHFNEIGVDSLIDCIECVWFLFQLENKIEANVISI